MTQEEEQVVHLIVGLLLKSVGTIINDRLSVCLNR